MIKKHFSSLRSKNIVSSTRYNICNENDELKIKFWSNCEVSLNCHDLNFRLYKVDTISTIIRKQP